MRVGRIKQELTLVFLLVLRAFDIDPAKRLAILTWLIAELTIEHGRDLAISIELFLKRNDLLQGHIGAVISLKRVVLRLEKFLDPGVARAHVVCEEPLLFF